MRIAVETRDGYLAHCGRSAVADLQPRPTFPLSTPILFYAFCQTFQIGRTQRDRFGTGTSLSVFGELDEKAVIPLMKAKGADAGSKRILHPRSPRDIWSWLTGTVSYNSSMP